MNERIQELHEQAMKSCDEHRSDILNYHRIYREKFAELIVRECIRLCDQVDLAGADDCIDNIKDYFEIEK